MPSWVDFNKYPIPLITSLPHNISRDGLEFDSNTSPWVADAWGTERIKGTAAERSFIDSKHYGRTRVDEGQGIFDF